MASATVIKYPDGRTESRNILTSFEKNGTSIIVFETDKVDNGHKVVGVSYLSDGMYQNIVDANKWNEAKGYLVDILHDRMTENDYRLVPAEILVTADPYHSLALRDENLDKMSADYENFVVANQVVEVVEDVPAETIDAQPDVSAVTEVTPEEDIVADIPILNNVAPVSEENETENVMDIVDEVIDPFNNQEVVEQPEVSTIQPDVAPVQENVVMSEAPVLDAVANEPIVVGDIPEVVPAIEESVSAIEPQVEVVAEPVVVGEIPAVTPVSENIVPEVGVTPEASLPGAENIQPVIMDNPVLDQTMAEPVNMEAPIMNDAPALEPVLDIPQMPVDNTQIDVVPTVPVENSNENIIQFPSPVINDMPNAQVVNESPIVSVEPVIEQTESVVKDSYEKTAADIIQQMRELTEEYLNKMEEMRAEISRNLEEAKGINELSKQTFDRAQAMVPVQQNVEPVLELTKAA